MIGPGLTWTIRPSTSKSWSFLRRVSALSCSSSCVTSASGRPAAAAAARRAGAGTTRRRSLPKSKVSCQARPCLVGPRRGAARRRRAEAVGGLDRLRGMAAAASAGSGATAVLGDVLADARSAGVAAARAVSARGPSAPYETCVRKRSPIGKPAREHEPRADAAERRAERLDEAPPHEAPPRPRARRRAGGASVAADCARSPVALEEQHAEPRERDPAARARSAGRRR